MIRHQIFNRKAALREVYHDFHARIRANLLPGRTLELGAGTARLAGTISTDIELRPWLDCVADANQLPFAIWSVDNVVMIDTLHHTDSNAALFEVMIVLKTGGRLILIEPAMTLGSRLFYRLFHHESVESQSIGTKIARSGEPGFRLISVSWFSFFAWPLSGGFQPWSVITAPVARWLLRLERWLEPRLGRWLAFRVMIVMERV